jgi:hypothetical protein
MVRIRFVKGPLAGRDFELEESKVYRLGREPEAAEELSAIELPSQTVSRNHAEIFFEHGQWKIRDLKSFNGIRVNRRKVPAAALKSGDRVELGEFGFKLEAELARTLVQRKTAYKNRADAMADAKQAAAAESEGFAEDAPDPNLPLAMGPRESPIARLRALAGIVHARFERLDFKFKIILLMILGAIGFHFVSYQALHTEARLRFLAEARKNAQLLAENLGERSKLSLAQSQLIFDCEGYGRNEGVNQAFILGKDGGTLCPIGVKMPKDDLFLEAQRTQNRVDTCGSKLLGQNGDQCEVVYPVRVRKEGAAPPELVGYTRILFEPLEFNRAIDKFSSIRTQTLILVLIFSLLLVWAVLYWTKQGIRSLTEEVHLLYTGTAQNVESLQSFAAFDELVAELNRLISKVNQGVKGGAEGSQAEAGFLQTLLDQVFLLEERAVMAVDPDNQVMAVSGYLQDIVPMQSDWSQKHVTEAIADTHLQMELMAFLNELSGSPEVMDRAVSATDRILQVRGMPLLHQGKQVATLLFFYQA